MYGTNFLTCILWFFWTIVVMVMVMYLTKYTHMYACA